MGGRLPRPRGVVPADQALQPVGSGEPAPLHREGFPVAHLGRQTAEAAIREKPHPFQIFRCPFQWARSHLGLRPIGADGGFLPLPTPHQLLQGGGRQLPGAAARTELPDQHQVIKAA